MPLWLFFGMWWVPEMFLTMAFMMLLYYWAKIYSGFRHLALFSRSSFRMKVHILEGVFTLCVWAGQFCIYILVVVMPEGSEASLRAQVQWNCCAISHCRCSNRVYILRLSNLLHYCITSRRPSVRIGFTPEF